MEIGIENDISKMFKLERVYLDNPIIEYRTYKLLGVFLDEYLGFDKHISYICAKLSKATFCIKRASNKLSLKSLKALYYCCIHKQKESSRSIHSLFLTKVSGMQ